MRSPWIASLALLIACGSSGTTPPTPPPPVNTGCNGSTTNQPAISAMHIPTDPIIYTDNPPAGGNHRPSWAKWGEYANVPPEYWIHNLEHGGAALLYNETAATTLVDALRTYARARDPDAGGAFRYVLSSYQGLPTKIAVVTWEWIYQADDVCPGELDEFLDAHYRKATEDIAADGSYAVGWIAR